MQNFNLNMNPLNLSNPLQQIMELNQKALKKFSYMEPQELTKFREPKALLEKNMEIFIDNGHASLEYVSQLFNIYKNSWANVSSQVGEKSKDFMRQARTSATSAMNKMSSPNSKEAQSHSVSPSSKKKTSRASSHTSGTHTMKRDESPKSSSSSAKRDNSPKEA
jgi:hypothetical protein